MSLIEFNSGELALASDMNNNFNYLDSLIAGLSDNITTQTANFAAQVSALNTSVNNVLSYMEFFVPTGTILAFGGGTIPSGYLLCDGSEISRSEFADLFGVIGTAFGSTDSATFCIPNLENKTLWGAGISNLGTNIPPKLPNVEGTFRLSGTEGSSSVTGMFSAGAKGGSYGLGHDGGAKNPLIVLDASSQSDIYTDNFNSVQPPAVAVKFIIKY